MTKPPRRRAQPSRFTPLTMTWREVATDVFRTTEQWLRQHMPEFEGFPRPDPALDVFATKAVEQWVDARFGLTPAASPRDDEALLMSRIGKHGQGERPLSRRTAA